MSRALVASYTTLLLCLLPSATSHACSTFKFQEPGALIYAHNLDQPERDMPGMIYVNKRGVFKTGTSFSEMFFDTPYHQKSDFCWISRYGSVTFSIFGRNFPDGGVNEAGIFIWEMGLPGTKYPENPDHPRLLKMNWMQYVLDCFGTLDDALTAAYDINIEGWQWHFFVGDRDGDCATVEFIDGEVVIHRGAGLPLPALFNRPYDQELEYLQLYKGFGGLYEPDLALRLDKRVPRMVRTAVLLQEYDPAVENPLTFSKRLLYEVGNKPYKWGILVDVVKGLIHFNTEQNQEWKYFSVEELDFSNREPVMVLNIDQITGGNVLDRFHPHSESEFSKVFKGYVDDLPDRSMDYYGISRTTMIKRFTKAYLAAEDGERQSFRGTWQGRGRETGNGGNQQSFNLILTTDGSNVTGSVIFQEETCSVQHLRLIGDEIEFSFRDNSETVYLAKGRFNGGALELHLEWINGPLDDYILQKQ